MFGNFDNIFKNKKSLQIPKTMLKSINFNSNLPEGYKYKDFGGCCYIDHDKDIPMQYKGNLIIDKDILNKLKEESNNELNMNIFEYLYRTQTPIEVDNLQVLINGQYYKFQENPFKTNTKAFLSPKPFPPAENMKIQIIGGKAFDIKFKRQPYASMDTVLIMNENFKILTIKLFLTEDNSSSSNQFSVNINITLNLNEAKTVTDLIDALEIYRGFMTSSILINNNKLPEVENAKYDKDFIESGLNIWNKILEVEKLLGLSFNPSVDVNEEELNLLINIYDNLIENKITTIYNCINTFTAKVASEINFNDYLNKPGINIEFLEEKSFNLLGETFKLTQYVKISDYIITCTEKLSDDLIRFSIAPEKNKDIKLEMLYFKEKEKADDYIKNLHNN